MARQFNVPRFYRSPIIARVKSARLEADPRKHDQRPSVLDFGPVRFKIARHFGFCYGVENAIDRAYRALDENPGRRIFLLSEMIHNPHVNEDLRRRGIRFLRTTTGEQIHPFEDLTAADVVIIPAFGATLEVEADLRQRGLDPIRYNTTCPFVEKVWKKSRQIGDRNYTVVVHGKHDHEETRATFSHAREAAPVVVVRDLDEAEYLARVIRGDDRREVFFERFADRCTDGFDPDRDLRRIGVVNQTTMLATETEAIALLLRRAMVDRYGAADVDNHVADTSDTLCYATNENQEATRALVGAGADVALIVGGYNSSNTSHLVELAEARMPTYFIRDADEIDGPDAIHHFDLNARRRTHSERWLPERRPVTVALTAGASCPDVLLDEVIQHIIGWFPDARSIEEALSPFEVVESP